MSIGFSHGRVDLYRHLPSNEWVMFKSGVSLSNADSTIKHAKDGQRLVAVSHGVVIAATDGEDFDLVFEEVETVEVICG